MLYNIAYFIYLGDILDAVLNINITLHIFKLLIDKVLNQASVYFCHDIMNNMFF